MQEFNVVDPIGSIYESSFRKKNSKNQQKKQLGGLTSKLLNNKLVEFVAYCINPNHYHFLVRQISEKGIEKFMHRLATGYTMYFNEKERRAGSLFQGTFKSILVTSNEYLLHLSAYINLNDRVHKLKKQTPNLVKSSWEEYTDKEALGICEKSIILEQFKNTHEYKNFVLSSLETIQKRKEEVRNIETFLLE